MREVLRLVAEVRIHISSQDFRSCRVWLDGREEDPRRYLATLRALDRRGLVTAGVSAQPGRYEVVLTPQGDYAAHRLGWGGGANAA